jgi:hypothetical protein
MKILMFMLVLGLAGLGFSVMHVTGSTPMTCLKDCCTNACGNGQWDSDGGFCHGPQDNTSACLSCQSNCRAGIQPHIAGGQTTTVSVANNSAPAQNATSPKANASGSTQATHTTGSQPAQATPNNSTPSFSLGGLWMVVGAILAIIVLAILLLRIKV